MRSKQSLNTIPVRLRHTGPHDGGGADVCQTRGDAMVIMMTKTQYDLFQHMDTPSIIVWDFLGLESQTVVIMVTDDVTDTEKARQALHPNLRVQPRLHLNLWVVSKITAENPDKVNDYNLVEFEPAAQPGVLPHWSANPNSCHKCGADPSCPCEWMYDRAQPTSRP